LQQKFNSSIPKRARKLFVTYRMINRITSKKMSWKEVKRCAKLYDCEVEEREEEKVKREYEESEEDIVINVGQNWLKNEGGSGRKRQHGNKVFYSDSYRNNPTWAEERQFDRSGRNQFNRDRSNLRRDGGLYSTDQRAERSINNVHHGQRNSNGHNEERRNGYNGIDSQSRRTRTGLAYVPNSLKRKAVVCYNCKKLGHVAAQCQSEVVCYRCGGGGHFARACPSANVPRYGNRSRSVGDIDRQRYTNSRENNYSRVNGNFERNSRSNENLSNNVVAGDNNTRQNVDLSGGSDFNRVPVEIELHRPPLNY